LFDFVIFSVIFNGALIIIFDSVKNASEKNKKVRENKRLKDIANKDALTNLQNRLAYMSFAQEKTEDRDDDASFIFAILDIDNFKSINDTKGHAEGDRVLKLVGKTITEHFKKADCNSFRIGGDEFVLIFENKKMDEVQGSIRKLNNKLLKNNGITLSYGCSQVDFECKNPFEEAYKKADSNMYENKQSKKTCD
ncbi:MAG: GGDEF domain-containing protein, partial [Clostridia bacterium]|nr:GGDEF domain-containing protein [Clostridia bacterium]